MKRNVVSDHSYYMGNLVTQGQGIKARGEVEMRNCSVAHSLNTRDRTPGLEVKRRTEEEL